VSDGDAVELESAQGAIRIVAHVTSEVARGAVVAEGIWWPSWSREGRGINALTSNRLSDLGGGSAFHGEPVALRPDRANDRKVER